MERIDLFADTGYGQSPRAFWPADERPERLWDNRLHFPIKRGFRSYDVWLSLNGSKVSHGTFATATLITF